MAKKEKKLALVPATPNALAANSFIEQLPDKAKLKRISSPQLLKVQQIPVGATVSGVIIGLIQNLAKKKEMKNALVIQLHHKKSDRHFMLPMTGTIKAAMLPYIDNSDDENVKFKDGDDSIVGKTVFFTRREDGKAKRYGGNTMFNFDVDIMD